MDLWHTSLCGVRDKDNDELKGSPNEGQQCDDTYEHDAVLGLHVSTADHTSLWKSEYDMVS